MRKTVNSYEQLSNLGAAILGTVAAIVLTLVVLLSSAAHGHDDFDMYFLYQQTKLSTVRVNTETGGGSGVFIEENYILTNEHVTAGALTNKVTILMTDKVDGTDATVVKEVEAEIIYESAKQDIAILYVAEVTGEPVIISSASKSKIGETVYSVSSPYGAFNTLLLGHITMSPPVKLPFDGVYFGVDMDLAPGSSGGGIFNMKGELIGICNLLYGRLNPLEFGQDANIIFFGADDAILQHKEKLTHEELDAILESSDDF